MTKILVLVGCVLMGVNAGTYGGQKIGLEDIEKDYNSNQKSSFTQPKASSSVTSPTKFGFVPKRTISSYTATKPRPQFLQTTYKVNQSPPQTQSSQNEQKYTTQYTQPQSTYQQQYSTGSSQQYALPSSSDYAELYSSGTQQYASQQQVQDYAYVQPGVQQQYTIQYQQQPGQQYEQYENVQYVTDNSIAKTESQPQQYYSQAPQPQYYYVQQFPSPSNAIESVIDPKALQYVTYIPSYAPNSIPIDQKQIEAYSSGSESQLPPVTTTVAKHTIVSSGKSSSSKQHTRQKEVQYIVPSAKTQYYKQDQILFQREPKSLLDSYVPSIVQLQYLKQQGKSGYSKL